MNTHANVVKAAAGARRRAAPMQAERMINLALQG